MADQTNDEMRERVIKLVFGGDTAKFDDFINVLREDLPSGTGVVIRGSAVTGERWEDGAPFDAEGEGTSDVDLTLIGDQVINLYNSDGFYIPLIHTKPLCDEDHHIAPDLVPLRERLQGIVKRPVNIQATRDFVRFVREVLIGQPQLAIIERKEAL
ncbi:MAG TPA: hypothetical protein VKN18_09820 [Blastocatellia bacterium]|nr:hypothetical protein [Blastocatellia bacterium]